MKVVSLFAGCGGLDLGLIQAGNEIVYASDIDADCQKTYELNIGNHFHLEDVHNLDTSKLPKFDILAGGFPCQGFSVANIHRTKNDSRNQLYTQIVRILSETKPKFFIAENVPGILSLEKGKIVEIIQDEFSSIGYKVKRYLLNAADYGVAQNRKRVIFLGISNSFSNELIEKMFYCFPPTYTNSNIINSELSPYKTLKDCIGNLPDPNSVEGKKIYNHYGLKHKVKINGYIGNRALSWDKPSPTIVGRGGGTGGPVIAVHPNLNRRFTVRETARIQGFPDNFIFAGATSSQFRQIGNAVAVGFAFHLGKALKKIEEIYKTDKSTHESALISDSNFMFSMS